MKTTSERPSHIVTAHSRRIFEWLNAHQVWPSASNPHPPIHCGLMSLKDKARLNRPTPTETSGQRPEALIPCRYYTSHSRETRRRHGPKGLSHPLASDLKESPHCDRYIYRLQGFRHFNLCVVRHPQMNLIDHTNTLAPRPRHSISLMRCCTWLTGSAAHAKSSLVCPVIHFCNDASPISNAHTH